MPLPTAGDVHVNRPLTSIMTAYIQAAKNFVASQVFPLVGSDKQSDLFFEYDRADWNRVEAVKRAPGTESAGAGWRVTNSSFFCDVYAVHKDVSDEARANQDAPIDLDRDATRFVAQQLLLRRDIDWAARYFATGVWGFDLDGVAAAPGANQFLQWDQAGSDPIGDVDSYKDQVAEATGFDPNVLVLGPHVFRVLKNHADVLDRIKYTERGIVTADLLASLFDVEKVIVAKSFQTTSKEGAATTTTSFIAGKHALLAYAAPSPSIEVPSAGYTFAWRGLVGAGADGNRISSFRMEHLKSDRVEGEMAFAHKLVASKLGAFFESAVA